MLRFALLVAAAFPLLAQTYTMTPTSGSTAGGTEVTITGDFAPGQYMVFFNDEPATSTTLVDAHTLVVITPPHLPGRRFVTIFRDGHFVIFMNVIFTFDGGAPATFKRVLLPIFTRPVYGAFGSEFHTALRMSNSGTDWGAVYGLAEENPCGFDPCITDYDYGPYSLAPGDEMHPSQVAYTGKPGRIVWVKNDADLPMNLRVHDVTRSQLNFGTEIPIVRENDWLWNRIVLLGVPTDPRFRNTLRIYGQVPFTALVKVGDREPVRVTLSEADPPFEVPYGVFSDFPDNGAPTRVIIDVERDFTPGVPIPVAIWAMITVTNNDTQVITTITPQQ